MWIILITRKIWKAHELLLPIGSWNIWIFETLNNKNMLIFKIIILTIVKYNFKYNK